MSDHNKMLIDRIKGMPAQPGDLSEEIGWLLQEIDEQKVELDTLRAENRALNEMLDAEKRAVAKTAKAVTAENERLREALSFEIDAHEHLAKICGFGTLESIRERRAALAPDPPKETEG